MIQMQLEPSVPNALRLSPECLWANRFQGFLAGALPNSQMNSEMTHPHHSSDQYPSQR